MFDRILVANRGEIACRVIETARRMGVSTVAVHSDADAASRHVRMADTAVCIGAAAPADSYLRIDAVVAAARAEGAQAVHPGYGFLSENPDFARAVEAAGLVFVGPSADAMAAMGLKDSAKRLMEEAGVPVVPGLHDGEDDPERLRAAADRIGYPVLIKAVAGGGGRGMRFVEGPEAFGEALESAPRRGESGLRQRPHARREVRRAAAAHRGPDLRRRRARRASVRARLLAAAPPPEGDRGGPRAGHDAADAAGDGRGGGAGGRIRRLQGGGDGRVHRRRIGRAAPRRVLVHGDEHPASGGASGDRGDRGRRSR